MYAKTIQDQVTTLMTSVDGVPIPHLQEYRIQSPPFNFTLPQNNILGMLADTTTQAAPVMPTLSNLLIKLQVLSYYLRNSHGRRLFKDTYRQANLLSS
jgi:hypothetical protein